MRSYAIAIAAAAVFAFSAPSQTLALGSRGVQLGAIQQGRSVGPIDDCAGVRKACLDKNTSGKQSSANCKKYREKCGRD